MPAEITAVAARSGPRGLVIDESTVPLRSFEVPYFAVSTERWAHVLRQVRALGATFVETPVPWALHETSPGAYDFGETNPALDLQRFLRLTREAGLYCGLRLGPRCSATMAGFGIPERILWDERCQARSASGAPVAAIAAGVAVPCPSTVSEHYLTESTRWLEAVARAVGDWVTPAGPIAFVELDDGNAFFGRTDLFDQDYRPEAVAGFRAYLARHTSSLDALRQAYGAPTLDFSTVRPPARFDSALGRSTAPQLDWARFRATLPGTTQTRWRRSLRSTPLGSVVWAETVSREGIEGVLDLARPPPDVSQAAAECPTFVTVAIESSRHSTQRLTTANDLAGRGAVLGVARAQLAVAAVRVGGPGRELPLGISDGLTVALAALASGVRGLRLEGAVDTPGWVGGLVGEGAEPAPHADAWVRLFAALDRTRFEELAYTPDARIIVPAALGHRVLALGDFGLPRLPWLDLLDTPARATSAEEAFASTRALGFVATLTAALRASNATYSIGSETTFEQNEARAFFIVCDGTLARSDLTGVDATLERGVPVIIGPTSLGGVSSDATDGDLAFADEQSVGELIDRLFSRSTQSLPSGAQTMVHRDAEGIARVLFVLNHHSTEAHCRCSAEGCQTARDALTDAVLVAEDDHLELRVGPQEVRMLELRRGS